MAKDCGDGVYVFGIPLWEGPRAADCRRNDRTDRRAIEEASDVAKAGERTDRTEFRSYEDAYQTFFRNYGTGVTPLEGAVVGVADAGFGAYGQIGSALAPFALAAGTGGASAIPSALGGVLGQVGSALGLTSETDAGEATDLTPLVLAGAAAVVLVMVLAQDDGRKR